MATKKTVPVIEEQMVPSPTTIQEEKKKSFSIGVTEELYNKIKEDADRDDRPMSRQLARYYAFYVEHHKEQAQ